MNKTETLHLRLSSELVELIRRRAEEETRTIAKQVEHLLKTALENEDNMNKNKVIKGLIELLVLNGVELGEMRDALIDSGMTGKQAESYLEAFKQFEKDNQKWFIKEREGK